MSTSNNLGKEQIISMLAQGIPTSQIAAALGVDDSYISQLKADPEVQQQVAEQAAAATVKDLAFDELLESAEEKALERIEKNIHFANMGQALAAFRVLNGAKKRREASLTALSGTTAVTVNLTLPAINVVNYTTNRNNEIVEVEGKTMISASVRSLDSILAQRAGERQAALPRVTDIEQAAARLDQLAPPRSDRAASGRQRAQLPAVLSADML